MHKNIFLRQRSFLLGLRRIIPARAARSIQNLSVPPKSSAPGTAHDDILSRHALYKNNAPTRLSMSGRFDLDYALCARAKHCSGAIFKMHGFRPCRGSLSPFLNGISAEREAFLLRWKQWRRSGSRRLWAIRTRRPLCGRECRRGRRSCKLHPQRQGPRCS